MRLGVWRSSNSNVVKISEFSHIQIHQMYRQFFVKFKFRFSLKKTVSSAWPAEKHGMVNNKHSHTHSVENKATHGEQPVTTGGLKIKSAELSSSACLFSSVLQSYSKLSFANTVCKWLAW